jgi:uncharacterized protein (DUF4415 family)
MKPDNTSKKPAISPEAMQAALKAAPDQINESETSYNANSPAAVEAYWENAVVTHSKDGLLTTVRRIRGKNKQPTKEQVSVRYSPEVLEYFRSTGKGWQTRMDEVLQQYVKQQKTA